MLYKNKREKVLLAVVGTSWSSEQVWSGGHWAAACDPTAAWDPVRKKKNTFYSV